MLKVECEIDADYRLRCSRVIGWLVDAPDLTSGKPLLLRDRNGLAELSFLFFTARQSRNQNEKRRGSFWVE